MSEIYIKQEQFDIFPKVDALLFDVDGVILEVSGSFTAATIQTVQYYCTQILKWTDTGALLEPDDVNLFKMAGGFNNDWELTYTAVALLLAKQCRSGVMDTAGIRQETPSWQEFTREVKRRGGGFSHAERYLLEIMTPTQRRNFAVAFNPKLITQLFQEMYGGTECHQLYGFHPEHLQENGLYKTEKVLLNTDLIPSDLKIGLLTGRTTTEARLAMQMAKLEIEEKFWVSEDSGLRKPDGHALARLHYLLNFKCAIFIGDTADDLAVVQNYRELTGVPHAKVLSCIVLPEGEKNRRLFLEAGADIVANDANEFLTFFKQVRHAKRKHK